MFTGLLIHALYLTNARNLRSLRSQKMNDHPDEWLPPPSTYLTSHHFLPCKEFHHGMLMQNVVRHLDLEQDQLEAYSVLENTYQLLFIGYHDVVQVQRYLLSLGCLNIKGVATHFTKLPDYFIFCYIFCNRYCGVM
jgi:hypothetical protein